MLWFNLKGMEYLHAKKIELGKLCSRNIFLESKVKIGMTDYIYKHAPSVKYVQFVQYTIFLLRFIDFVGKH